MKLRCRCGTIANQRLDVAMQLPRGAGAQFGPKAARSHHPSAMVLWYPHSLISTIGTGILGPGRRLNVLPG